MVVRSPFSKKVENPSLVGQSKLTDARIKYKNTVETVKMLKGMTIQRAIAYLNNVIDNKEIVTATKFNNGRGRKAQCKQFNQVQGFHPQKICKVLIKLVENAANNAVQKGLNRDKLFISAIQANPARVVQKRHFASNGRIKKFNRSPSHVFIMVEEKQIKVPLPKNK
ncbi:MAG: 60S ribosomal protein L17 [Marteilia pararefringens]